MRYLGEAIGIGFIILILATAAHAGERVTIHHDPAAGDAWFARVEVSNHRDEKSLFNQVVRLETAHGPVTVSYRSTYNVGCHDDEFRCADEITVTDLPAGVIAVPQSMLLLEDATEQIFLFEYLGG